MKRCLCRQITENQPIHSSPSPWQHSLLWCACPSFLRFDPLGGGTGAVETFDFDYVMLDRVRTIGLAEFDDDGAMDGWTNVGNGHLTNTGTNAATSTFTATPAGVDPIMQLAGLNIDTNIFDTVGIRMVSDLALSFRFEFF